MSRIQRIKKPIKIRIKRADIPKPRAPIKPTRVESNKTKDIPRKKKHKKENGLSLFNLFNAYFFCPYSINDRCPYLRGKDE